MSALLSFCKSGTGQLILILLFGVSVLVLQMMIVTTALRWFIRFVKDAWD